MKITIDFFKQMIDGGAKSIDLESRYINDLNVFPVPDGDTGINLKTTINGAIDNLNIKEINKFGDFALAFSRSLLMNARGNSGVIFSQIMSGFCSNFNNEQKELRVKDLIDSFRFAKEKAYSSVSNPIEGTILTVIREISEALDNNEAFKTVEELFENAVIVGTESLNRTPELLEELAQVGVVDSGGYGLMSFLKGMNAVLRNDLQKYLKELENDEKIAFNFDKEHNSIFDNLKEEMGFGYCSEIILSIGAQINPNNASKKIKFNKSTFLKEIEAIGNSIVLVHDNSIVKVHVHTMTPHRLLEIGQKYGEFEKVKFENMTNQFLQNKEGRQTDFKDKKKYLPGTAIIATVPTREIADLFANEYNIKNTIITCNDKSPSIQDFINKIHDVGYRNVFIITDDSNIVLAATEAGKLVQGYVNVEIIPSKNVFESLAAITVFDADDSFKQNYKDMMKILKKTLSASVSTSVKDVSYSHINVKKDEKIGIIDKKIVATSKNVFTTLVETLDKLMEKAKDVDICYLVYGKNVSLATVKKFEKYASETYGLFCEIQFGNQEVYDVYFGLQ